MVENNHTFNKGEIFTSNIENERYNVIDVKDDHVVYEYKANGNVLAVRREEKQHIRMFIQSGYWKLEDS